jgi:NADH dehydrogenase
VVSGNVLQPDSLRGAADGCDAVIHLVGIISEVGEQTFENVHFRATQNVLAEAKRAGAIHWIQMSALGTRPKAVSRYHQTKWLAEEAVRASGLDWTILRPSLIYGPEDHFVNLFAQMIRWSPVLPVMGDGQSKLQPVSVEDVARCFVGAVSEPRSIGQTLDVCGPDRLTFNEVLDAILIALGKRRLKLHLPLPLARLQAALFETLFPLVLRKAPPLNRDQLLMLQEDNVGDARPAVELFQLTPPRFSEDIRRYLSGH